MKLLVSGLALSAIALSGCVSYDSDTTGRVGRGYGERVYSPDDMRPISGSRIVEDRYGNLYRLYPDGTLLRIGRSVDGRYGNYPYGPYPYGGAYPYGNYPYGGYRSGPYIQGGVYGGSRGVGYGGSVGYGHVYAPRPRVRPPAPNTRVPASPQAGVSTPAPVYTPPPMMSPSPSASMPGSRAEQSEARRESRKSREAGLPGDP